MGRIKSEAGHAGIKRGPKGRKEAAVKNGFDGPLTAPWRKTATIFKQPITLVHSTRSDTTETPSEKLKKYSQDLDSPLPIFWAKSLEGIVAMAPIHKCDKVDLDYLQRDDEYVPQRTGLPESVLPYCNILRSEGSALSLTNALCKSNPPTNGVIGQPQPNSTKRGFDNPCHNANSDQPLVVGITKILPEDVSKQEQQILDMRKRLNELRNSFMFHPSTCA